MKQYYFSVYLLLVTLTVCGQKRDNIWLLGYYNNLNDPNFGGMALDFNTMPPEIYPVDNDMFMFDTNASICDEEGNLLFYTNGQTIGNAVFDTMQNGGGLNPGDFAESNGEWGYWLPQGAFILPKPGNPTSYYLIHEDIQYATYNALGLLLLAEYSKHLYFSEIDMSLENGLGAVVKKNQILRIDTLSPGQLTCTRHANGRDWWMVAHELTSKNYFRFLISPEGITEVGKDSTEHDLFKAGYGQAAFSPDGTVYARLASYEFSQPPTMDVYKFDRCSGFLSDHQQIHIGELNVVVTSLSISPNSRYLYAATQDKVFQFDLEAPVIAYSKKLVAEFDGFYDTSPPFTTLFFYQQLAPNGKIYMCTANGTRYLHVIHQPNLPYPNCNLEQHSITLPRINGQSLPNFPNYRLGPLDDSPCDTLGLDNHPVALYRYGQDVNDYLTIEFTDLSYYEPIDWHWDFGDNTTDTNPNPIHEFPSDGTYEVCLTVSNQYDTSTYCRMLIIGTGISATAEPNQPADLVSVFPNPAQSATNFRLGGDYLPREAMLTLYSATGQPVHTQRLMAGWSVVGLEGLAKGMYFWEVRDACLPGQGDRQLGAGKLVKVE